MTPIRTRALQIFVVGAFALLFTTPFPAAAQSLLVEGLQLMASDVRNADQRREVIDLGRELHQELTGEVDELQDLEGSSSGYLLRDEAGNYVSASQADIADLAGTLAADMVFADDRYTTAMALLSRAENGGDLERAVADTIFSFFQLQTENSAGGNVAEYFEFALTDLVRDADEVNRQHLNGRIQDLHKMRAQVSGIVEQVEAMQGAIVPPAPDAPEGFMNEPGYYVAQVSGMGWRKGGAGHAFQITGYANFIFEVTEEVTDLTETRYLWQVPPGYDIMDFERMRQERAEANSRENCAGLPGLGPRDPAPEIWADGPHYEIVQGPIADRSEADAIRGNPRLNNNAPGGSRFWHYEDYSWKELDPVCERYGVSLVD